jgi:hypothetical protein
MLVPTHRKHARQFGGRARGTSHRAVQHVDPLTERLERTTPSGPLSTGGRDPEARVLVAAMLRFQTSRAFSRLPCIRAPPPGTQRCYTRGRAGIVTHKGNGGSHAMRLRIP